MVVRSLADIGIPDAGQGPATALYLRDEELGSRFASLVCIGRGVPKHCASIESEQHCRLGGQQANRGSRDRLIWVALLYRLREGIEPTPAGDALYRYVKNMARIAEDMDAELSEFSSGAKGHVRLWANTSAVTQFLPEDLALYVNELPGRQDRSQGGYERKNCGGSA